jgi:hypothetical protein
MFQSRRNQPAELSNKPLRLIRRKIELEDFDDDQAVTLGIVCAKDRT